VPPGCFSASPAAFEIVGLLREDLAPEAAKAAVLARYEVEGRQLD
jgi:hypothetical protein